MAAPGCRWCGGRVVALFSRRVLGKHNVAYLECTDCKSLQTEASYWLEDAYRHSLAALDTGAAQRNLDNLAASYAICQILALRNVLDFGGGDGLLCRLLRDYGINCFVEDKYAPPTYALAFTAADFDTPELLLAFEVLEHFQNPQVDLKSIFDRRPRAILASTQIYRGQGSDWWYLTPETGQHLFFYSDVALREIAQSYGYRLIYHGSYLLFAQAWCLNPLRSLAVHLAFSKIFVRLAGALLRFMPTSGVWKDYQALRDRTGNG
jgi:hypothetical protein